MEYEKTRLMVLARIPNLGVAGSEVGNYPAFPAEKGRLISQVTSFRLLAVTTLLLLLGAVIPFSFVQRASTPTTTSATPSSSSVSDPSPPQPDVAVGSPIKADDVPQMSRWPNPTHPTSPHQGTGVEGTQSDLNQTPIRSTLYQADARAGHQQPEPGSAPLKGLFLKPVIQNPHDRARSSIH